jgi:hypothetical protein
VHLGKRAFKVLDQLGEAPLYRARTGDQNIIIAFNRSRRSCEPYRLFQPPPRPIAYDSAAKALGCGEAEARNMVIAILIRNTAARLQDQRRRNEACSSLHMQELGAGLKTSDGRHRLPACRLKPTGACVLWLSAAPAPCVRPWSPCGRGSRGASCGRAAMVGRCVSRRCLLGRSYRSENPASGSAVPAAYRVRQPPKSIDPLEFVGL